MVKRCPKCGRWRSGDRTCRCKETLAPGTILAGRYLIVRAVGRGAAATVYQALDRMLDEPVAVKLLDAPSGGFAAAERLRSEIKLARRVTHPNVCRIHDYGEDGEHRFICMELIEGRNLRELLAERGPLGAGEACAVAAQAADALAAIHARGIVHRDVKTANLIRDHAGRVYVTDFGVATGGGLASGGRGAGYVIGTPEYMSPEQALGLRLDARSDLYALGIVLFEMLTGDVPFRGGTTAETLVWHVQHAPALGALSAAHVPDRLRDVIERLLAKRREDRPGSAAEVAAALRALAPTGIAPVVPSAAPAATTLVSNTLTLPRRTRRVLSLGRAAAVAAIAVAGWGVATGVRWETPRSAPGALTAPPRWEPTVQAAPQRPPAALPSATPTLEPERLPARAVAALHAPIAVEAPPVTAPVPATFVELDGVRDQSPAVGHLRFGIAPWAEVTVDGRPLGATPLREVPLPPGTYTARLVHPHFRPFQRKVTIRPGETTPLNVDLRLDGIRNR